MDVSPFALLTNFVPQIPSILLLSVLAVLGRTRNSGDQDVLTQIVVAAARPILRTPAALGRSQRVWAFLAMVAGWVFDLLAWLGLGWLLGFDGIVVTQETVRVNQSGDGSGVDGGKKSKILNVQQAIKLGFDVLRDPKHITASCPTPTLADVEVEWTTYHPRREAVPASIPFHDGFRHREKHAHTASSNNTSNLKPVILYFHGGAHCLMDPKTHRWTTNTLSKLSSSEICSVRFRLSPRHPFPAALTDALVAYLSLLAPSSASSTRAPILAERIIFAGDSSGGSLASGLLLLLLTLSRQNVTVHFNGHFIRIPSPPCAGLALTSPWLDVTRSLPSTSANERWDIIAPPPLDSASPPFPPDELWPTDPPRAETYCVADICTHPLVSPLAASPEQWSGAPAVWLCSGWEGFTDEIEVFARRVYQSGSDAIVYFEGWEGMPHCFGMMPWNKAGWEAMYGWANFCVKAVRGEMRRRKFGIWRTTMGDGKGIWREVDMDELGYEPNGVGYQRQIRLTDEVVIGLMAEGRSWRIGLENEMVRKWKDDCQRATS